IAQEVVAKALDDATRQAFEEEKRKIASQKRAAQATSINKLSIGVMPGIGPLTLDKGLFNEIPGIDGSWWKSVHPYLSGSSQGNRETRNMTTSCDTSGMLNKLTMSKTRSTCSWASSFLFREKVSSLNSRMN
ncbi:hypothetical protein Tco_0101333, partial [Tanacetum coccineum]